MMNRALAIPLLAVFGVSTGPCPGLPGRGADSSASLAVSSVAVPSAAVRSLESLPEEEFDLAAAKHLLMRAGFGGTHEEARRLHRLGLDGMVRWLVDYEARPDVLGPFAWRSSKALPSRADMLKLDEQARRKLRQSYRREDRQRMVKLREWWIDRMLATRRPLEERMTLFWHGHFTTSYRDVRSSKLVWLQNELLREQATGNFAELLQAISRDPAMLAYLNNNQNRKGRPNENYAREVMELFTLGIGNYAEKDIKEVARAFTGWTFDRKNGRFLANPRQHDGGQKTIFGKTGPYDGGDVCQLLLEHPACAPYIAGKIFAYFAYANPEPELVLELAALLRSRHFEIKPLLKRIFKSRAFYSARCRGRQVKSPVVLLVSTLRMLGMNPPRGALVAGAADRLGQSVFAPPNVRGWEGGLAWITTASLLERDNLCGVMLRAGLPNPKRLQSPAMRRAARSMRAMDRRLAGRAIGAWDPEFSACGFAQQTGAKTLVELVDALATQLLFVPLAPVTRAELLAFAQGKDGSLPLQIDRLEGADMERKLRELLHLLMSTPEFQVC